MTHLTSPAPPAPTFPCPVGVKHCPVIGTYLWVRSPRTGNTISVNKHLWDKLPTRLADRIVQGASVGRHTLNLTKAELQALVDVRDGAPTAAQRAAAESLTRHLSFRRMGR